MKTTFTETIQSYFRKKQKDEVINRIIEHLKMAFDKQAYELAKKLSENYNVEIILKENPDSTFTAMTVIRTDNPSVPTSKQGEEKESS